MIKNSGSPLYFGPRGPTVEALLYTLQRSLHPTTVVATETLCCT